jgi:hypothetical protein
MIIGARSEIRHRYFEFLSFEISDTHVVPTVLCEVLNKITFDFLYIHIYISGRSRFDPIQRQMIFPLAFVSRLALGPIQSAVQWVPGSFPRG